MENFYQQNKNYLLDIEIKELNEKKYEDIYYYKQILKKEAYLNKSLEIKYTNLESKNYIIIPDDHIDFRYKIWKLLGRGVYGKVIVCQDFKNNEYCAAKIIKNKGSFYETIQNEIDVLNHITKMKENENDLVKNIIIDFKKQLKYRKHTFLFFKMYYINVYEEIKNNKYKGLEINNCINITRDIIKGLHFIHKNKIVHCDLKPENIVFTNPTKQNVVIIDFGLAQLHNKIYKNKYKKYIQTFNDNYYLQSRYYRAPEVFFMLNKDYNIDIWSLGCIMYEILYGKPLFAAKRHNYLLDHYIKVIELPCRNFIIKNCLDNFFDKDFKPRSQYIKNNFKPGEYKLHELLIPEYNVRETDVNYTKKDINKFKFNKYIYIINDCICWDYQKRVTSKELEELDFIAYVNN